MNLQVRYKILSFQAMHLYLPTITNIQVGFINDIVAQLWPHINVAAGKIAKDVVEPILASMLPGPLSSLHFVKLDLGPVPIRFSNVDVHKTTNEAIKLDMDVDWQGKCDIELDGKNVPKIVSFPSISLGQIATLLNSITGHRTCAAERKAYYLALPLDQYHPSGTNRT